MCVCMCVYQLLTLLWLVFRHSLTSAVSLSAVRARIFLISAVLRLMLLSYSFRDASSVDTHTHTHTRTHMSVTSNVCSMRNALSVNVRVRELPAST